jgi:hypothetical protein
VNQDGDLLTGWAAARRLPRQHKPRADADVGGLRFAFYGRMSTEDYPDPVSSRWQLDFARELIGGQRRIVAEFFNVGYSRRRTWPNGPEAALLAAMPYAEFLELILGDEVTRRDTNSANLLDHIAGQRMDVALTANDQKAEELPQHPRLLLNVGYARPLLRCKARRPPSGR